MSPMDVDAPLVRIRNLMTCVPHGVTDIDAVCDPLKNTDYAQDICDYLQVQKQFGSWKYFSSLFLYFHFKSYINCMAIDYYLPRQI